MEKIDHSLPPPKPVAAAVTVEHGAYVAAMCIGCHGAGLSGGKIPGGPPDWLAAANITPGDKSVMPAYKDGTSFAAMMKTGKRPDGSAIKGDAVRIATRVERGRRASAVRLFEDGAAKPFRAALNHCADNRHRRVSLPGLMRNNAA